MAGEIEVKIDSSAMSSALRGIKDRLDAGTRAGVQTAAARLITTSVTSFNTPPAPTTRTGNLQRSIKITSSVASLGEGRYGVRVGPTTVYSRIIELGGTITPKREDGMLRWIGPNGKPIFARSVTIHPHPYFTPAFEKLRTQMRSIFEASWQNAIGS